MFGCQCSFGVRHALVVCGLAFALGIALPVRAQFVRGADIGWLEQMEATGYKFYDTTGVQSGCLQILQDHGINTVRLRVFVNPGSDKINGHCSKKEVVTMALRAKQMGMRYDIIGLSYYPFWLGSDYKTTINDLANNMNDMVSRYGKEVMVVEVGGDYLMVQNTYSMLVAGDGNYGRLQKLVVR